MTRLPLESRNVEPLSGTGFPRYKVGPICAHPLCSRPRTDNHHIFRRSFLAGDYWWVRFTDPVTGVQETVGNITGLCSLHHSEITVNIHRIEWLDGFWWVDGTAGPVAPLTPQPPRHGHEPIEAVTRHKHIQGPASGDKCDACGQRIRNADAKDAKDREPLRRRKTWVVKVPDDIKEDGGLALDILVDGCAEVFGHDQTPNMRFFTICQALALVLQNKHRMTSEGTEGADGTETAET